MSWFCNKNIFSTSPLPCGHLCQGWKRPAQAGLRGSGGLLSVLGWRTFPGPELLSAGRSAEGPGHVLRLCASCPPPRSLPWGTTSSPPAASLPAIQRAWVGKLPPSRSEVQCFCVCTAWDKLERRLCEYLLVLGFLGSCVPWLSDGCCGEAGACGYTLRKATSTWRREGE